jgi:N-methylhydantoinase B
MTSPLQAIRLQVMWNRLIAVVEEQAQALLRTAFGSVVRESGDLSAGVYNVGGEMIAQAVTGTPGHVNTMAMAVRHFLERYPLATMQPGDVYVTNDPWMGTGHLFDFVVVTPVFRDTTTVALFASTCHTVDVGGIGFSADARSVFEEGVLIPHLKLRDRDRLNDDLLAIAMANSRNPVELRGDVLALVSSNDVGAARLVDMMSEFELTDIAALAAHILESSERATLAAIATLPRGRFANRMDLDGYDSPIALHASLTVRDDGIDVDYEGSSPASTRGINSPICYTEAYSVFGLKCIIAPDVPNNAGSLRPFRVTAPPGSIVNPLRPAPVSARHVVGQMLADMMFGCLADAVGGQVPAEGAGSLWVLPMGGQRSDGRRYNVMGLGIGAMGARPTKDGLSTTAFPSGVGTTPVEVLEDDCPLVFLR